MTSPLYVPPHRRPKFAETQDAHQASVGSSYSSHANLRMQQRQISQLSAERLLANGDQEGDKRTVTYRNSTTFAVVGRGGKVITVAENYRNTKFDPGRQTRSREEILLQQVKRHNVVAMCELGEIYLNGALGKPDVHKAFQLFRKAAEWHKNSHAMCLLSNMYKTGVLGQEDPEMSFQWMMKAAELGNKFAAAKIGEHFIEKYVSAPPGTDPQEKLELAQKAIHYLEKSAAKGSTRAMWFMAIIYERGWLGEINLNKAIDLLVNAAERGSPSSLFKLSELINAGDFCAEKLEEILNKTSPIVGKNSSDIAVLLGLEQIEGRLGNSPSRGMAMLEDAARNRNVSALENLAMIYRDGQGEIKPDPALSQLWFNQLKELYLSSASDGNIDSMWELAELFVNGNLGDPDYPQAISWYMKAFDLGNEKAGKRLTQIYLSKNTDECISHTPGLLEAARNWAAMLENELEQIEYIEYISSKRALFLGKLYRDGELLQRNLEKAVRWFCVALSSDRSYLDFKAAKHELQKILSHDQWEYGLKEQIIKGLKSLAPNQNEGMYKDKALFRIVSRILGDVYNSGIIIERNLEQAVFWYKVSVEYNNSKAMYALGQIFLLDFMDITSAVTWFMESHKRNNEAARICLVEISAREYLEQTLKTAIEAVL